MTAKGTADESGNEGGAGRVLLVMGVAGAGKTTVARALADRLGWAFIEADELHPPVNVQRMAAGIPLTDADRAPWLVAVRAGIERESGGGDDVVVACSALRRSYRATLLRGLPRVAIVWLRGPADLLRDRIEARTAHFMPASLLESQLATLDPPTALADGDLAFAPWSDTALVLDAQAPADAAVETVLARLASP